MSIPALTARSFHFFLSWRSKKASASSLYEGLWFRADICNFEAANWLILRSGLLAKPSL